MQMSLSRIVAIFGIVLVFVASCTSDDDAYPRPRGYFRIDFPEKSYEELEAPLPFQFSKPTYASVKELQRNDSIVRFNLFFPWYDGTLHCHYQRGNDLEKHTNFSKEIAYKQQIFASAINEKIVSSDSSQASGVYYDIKGDVGGNVQFYLIDSVDQFFRGSFVFNVSPNYDSILPVLDYLKADFDKLISTFKWTDNP